VDAGKQVLPSPQDKGTSPDDRTYPGREAGLTGREAEIIALITQGLSNQEIAERSYLSINSVKTYIRTAYRKMGVTRRSQAVLWGIKNGMQPDVVRRVHSVNSR
jgi:DNA-binding CsgD family transcriptional regulator